MNGKSVNIIPYNSDLAGYFRQLNLAWVTKYFEVEPADEKMLSNPQQYILDKGGYVFFAQLGEDIAGTFAMLKVENGVYELSKMAVAEPYQGQRIGNAMIDFCLKQAKKLNAKKVILYSNTMLESAIHLYKKFGFAEVPLVHSDYKRSNIKMEIDIK